MELMARYPDNYFDLAIVDPPYGLGNRLSDGGGKLKNTPMATLYKNKDWDILPLKEYCIKTSYNTALTGKYVSLADTIKGFQAILSGELDSLPEQAFYLVGDLAEAIAKAEKIKSDNK
jgi:hypothetical protein